MPILEARPIQIGNETVWRLYFAGIWGLLGDDAGRDQAIRAYQKKRDALQVLQRKALQLKNRSGQPMTPDARRELTLQRLGIGDEVEDAARDHAEALFTMYGAVLQSLEGVITKTKVRREEAGGGELSTVLRQSINIADAKHPLIQRRDELRAKLLPYDWDIATVEKARGMLQTVLTGELGSRALTHPRSRVIAAYGAEQRERSGAGGGFGQMITR